MLSNQNRLRLDSDFKTVKEKGSLFQSEDFALAVYDRGDRSEPRFGFVVSTKISKSAVVRNGIKRALRAAVVELLPKIKRGVDCVFLVKQTILKKKKEDMTLQVERIVKVAKLLV